MAVLISFALFAALMVAISIYGYRRYAKPGRLYEQLGGPAAMTTPIIEELPREQPHFAVNVIEEIGKYVPTSPQDAALARRELIAAGYRNESAVAILFGLKIVLCAALVILGFCSAHRSRPIPCSDWSWWPRPDSSDTSGPTFIWTIWWTSGRKRCGYPCPTRSTCS